jgi:sigma-E factor negative regulatory protein RseB
MTKLLWLLGGLLVCGSALAADDAASWFERMRDAMQKQDFEGRFVYQVGQQLESMYVVHRLSGDAELERLVSLSGDSREVIRGDRAVACLQPGGRPVSVLEGARNAAGELSGIIPMQRIREHYRFQLDGVHRVAGRQAQLLEVIPRDNLRYGYRLFLDQETGLPLRSIMLDQHGKPISQMLFVDLKTGKDVTAIERDISALQQTDSAQITVPAGIASPDHAAWGFEGLPEGFQLVSVREEAAKHRQHLIFSDGIAVLSLYVEPEDGDPMSGYSQMGTTRIYAEPRLGMQITAVGEVPDATLRKTVQALQQR